MVILVGSNAFGSSARASAATVKASSSAAMRRFASSTSRNRAATVADCTFLRPLSDTFLLQSVNSPCYFPEYFEVQPFAVGIYDHEHWQRLQLVGDQFRMPAVQAPA